MKKIAIYIIGMVLGTFTMLTGCDVHEWPEEAETVAFYLRLNFETEMTSRDYYHEINASRANSAGYDFRYVLRAYPICRMEPFRRITVRNLFLRNLIQH